MRLPRRAVLISRPLLTTMTGMAMAFVLVVLAGCNLGALGAPSTTALPTISCDSVIPTMQAAFKAGCTVSNIGVGSACYGNRKIEVAYNPLLSATPAFDSPGAISALNAFSKIAAGAYNPQTGEWGIAVLRLRTNLPNLLPGQPVTFVLYGDTQLTDAASNQASNQATATPSPGTSGDVPATLDQFKAFYFTSPFGLTEACTGLPQGGLLIDSPDGQKVTFNADGAQITIGSEIILHAAANDRMSVSVLRGHVTVTALGQSVSATVGQEISVPLGGNGGLLPKGPPTLVPNSNINFLALPEICSLVQSAGVPGTCGSVIPTLTPTVTTTPAATATGTPTPTSSPTVTIPTATIPPTSTATWTPMPTTTTAPTPIFVVIVIRGPADLRTGPGQMYTLLGIANQGDTFQVLAQAYGPGTKALWYLIIGPNQTPMWISSTFVSVRASGAIPPAVTIPPTLTFTPSPTFAPPPPVAFIINKDAQGPAPLDVSFQANSTGGPVSSYVWSISNGDTLFGPTVKYTFKAEGTYTVTLTVTGPGGSSYAQTKIVVAAACQTLKATIGMKGPAFNAKSSHYEVAAYSEVDFYDASGGTAKEYYWDFGDGSSDSVANPPAHSYQKPTSYPIRLVIVDSCGNKSEDSKTLDVFEPSRVR